MSDVYLILLQGFNISHFRCVLLTFYPIFSISGFRSLCLDVANCVNGIASVSNDCGSTAKYNSNS